MKMGVRWLHAVLAALLLLSAVSTALGQARALARTMPSGPVYGPTLRLRYEVTAPAGSTADHPLFYSDYIGEEDRIVAKTRYGNITARDLYLWLIVRDTNTRPFLLEQFDKARTETQRKAFAKQLHQEINEYIFTNYVIPELMGNAPCDETAAYKAHIYTLPVFQLVYILRQIQPRMIITDADRVKYLRDHKGEITPGDRRRVQYIFLPSTLNQPIEAQDEVEAELYDIRDAVLEGELTFEEAAREYSRAPSAANGGEIPPFRQGELFFHFEDAAANLQPGEISEPFRGPKGFYIVRLLEILPPLEPTLEDPVQAAKVEEGLSRQVLKSQYTYEKLDLFRTRKAIYQHAVWDERRDCDTVGVICDFGITKEQFRAVFPNIEEERTLSRRDDLINKYIRSMLERQAMAQEVIQCGQITDPMITRARWMAENMTRRDGYIDKLYAQLNVSEEIVRAFWRDNPSLFTPLPMKRIVKVTMSPAGTATANKGALREMTRVLIGGEVEEETEVAKTESDDDEELLFSDEITTATRTVVGPEPGGGGPTTPAAGGEAPRDVAVVPPAASQAIPSAVYSHTTEPPTPAETGNWHSSPTLLPELTVTDTDETPSQYCPPPIGVLRRCDLPPYNPDCYFRRYNPSQFREVVESYTSSDFVMRYDDLGYLYVEDRGDIPKTINSVPVGAYSAPKAMGTTAVAYYVEDERRLPKPPFEEIKTRVYATYRDVEVDRRLQEKFKGAIESSRIEIMLEKPSTGEK